MTRAALNLAKSGHSNLDVRTASRQSFEGFRVGFGDFGDGYDSGHMAGQRHFEVVLANVRNHPQKRLAFGQSDQIQLTLSKLTKSGHSLTFDDFSVVEQAGFEEEVLRFLISFPIFLFVLFVFLLFGLFHGLYAK